MQIGKNFNQGNINSHDNPNNSQFTGESSEIVAITTNMLGKRIRDTSENCPTTEKEVLTQQNKKRQKTQNIDVSLHTE